jgi:hypothetical protein
MMVGWGDAQHSVNVVIIQSIVNMCGDIYQLFKYQLKTYRPLDYPLAFQLNGDQ